tara:strand:- start:3 stop:434 length:432 start_codon:yes stop_codon:yes gene_type:complete
MTLQEMFDKAIAHFTQMEKPSMSTPSEYGGTDCAYRGHEGNKCIVGAFIEDEHYESSFEGKGVLEYGTFNKSCGVQPVLSAVAASMGVEALDEDKANLLFQLQLIHDDVSSGFEIGVDNWYEIVEPCLIDLADDCGLEYANVG